MEYKSAASISTFLILGNSYTLFFFVIIYAYHVFWIVCPTFAPQSTQNTDSVIVFHRRYYRCKVRKCIRIIHICVISDLGLVWNLDDSGFSLLFSFLFFSFLQSHQGAYSFRYAGIFSKFIVFNSSFCFVFISERTIVPLLSTDFQNFFSNFLRGFADINSGRKQKILQAQYLGGLGNRKNHIYLIQ